MKSSILIVFFSLFFFTNAFATLFSINGSITGKESVNYAYIFDNNFKQLSKIEVVNRKFQYQGEVERNTKFGESPTISVLFSNSSLTEQEIINKRLLSNRKHGNCTLFPSGQIELSYNTDTKTFTIKADKLNSIQSLFTNGYASYRYSRDSIYVIIDKSPLSDEEREEKKNNGQAKMFTKAMFGFIDIIKTHPTSLVSLMNFPPIIYDQAISGKQAMNAFNYFSKDLRASTYGQRLYMDIIDKIKTEESIAKPAYFVGMKMPDFSLKNEKSQIIESRSIYSDYTLVDFWATWCLPCRKETPNVIDAFAKYGEKGFKVITVSIDDTKDKAKWIETIEKDKMMGFINLFNGNDISGLSRELKIVTIPANYLVDSKGIIVAKNLRGEMLAKKLEELFAGKN
ncbi:TlpA disulfide reductase family protein [Pedobacter sp. Leaf170]|uniref:TlpA family protein disulfide reductase n=1 Tax=Pedobacter sp. Leaf170 TaxID=2876558 RepID=UPI001E62E9FA|nr:TlpA disulfide reductase family protein [Pedobacter sp. Leaf170]